jgi:hypothetical protein
LEHVNIVSITTGFSIIGIDPSHFETKRNILITPMRGVRLVIDIEYHRDTVEEGRYVVLTPTEHKDRAIDLVKGYLERSRPEFWLFPNTKPSVIICPSREAQVTEDEATVAETMASYGSRTFASAAIPRELQEGQTWASVLTNYQNGRGIPI